MVFDGLSGKKIFKIIKIFLVKIIDNLSMTMKII